MTRRVLLRLAYYSLEIFLRFFLTSADIIAAGALIIYLEVPGMGATGILESLTTEEAF